MNIVSSDIDSSNINTYYAEVRRSKHFFKNCLQNSSGNHSIMYIPVSNDKIYQTNCVYLGCTLERH